MGLFDKIFGTTDMANAGGAVIAKTVDSIASGVDKFIYTKAEKAVDERLKEEQEFRFRTYEAENFQKVLDRDLEYYKQDTIDRSNARELAKAELNQEDIFVKRFRYYFACYWAITSCGYIGCITFINIPKENMRFADMILGFLLGTIIATIITFFYGSSHNSAVKDNSINNLTIK